MAASSDQTTMKGTMIRHRDPVLEAEADIFTMTLMRYDPPVICRIANHLHEIVGEIARPKRQRKPTLSGVIRQMERAGLEIARCEYKRDGTVNVVPGKPSVDISDDTETPATLRKLIQ